MRHQLLKESAVTFSKRFLTKSIGAAAFASAMVASVPSSATVKTYDLGLFEISFKVCRDVEIAPGVDASVCQLVTV